MSDCKIYPADTVDIYGNVWPTVGENIRNGMFGVELKQGVIDLNNGIVTSQDFDISKIEESRFIINKKAFFVYPISCSGDVLSFRTSFNRLGETYIISFVSLKNVIGKIAVLYTEE